MKNSIYCYNKNNVINAFCFEYYTYESSTQLLVCNLMAATAETNSYNLYLL